MAKDRNTMAKRQREVDKRQKAKDKRDNRERKKTETPSLVTEEEIMLRREHLSEGEEHVLAMFRKYLMTPGKMLCLSTADILAMKKSLDKLVSAGLLIPEEFKGGYSLTRSGYDAMHEMAS
jgi:hypothetical protein